MAVSFLKNYDVVFKIFGTEYIFNLGDLFSKGDQVYGSGAYKDIKISIRERK
jgi:hypothetical protein